MKIQTVKRLVWIPLLASVVLLNSCERRPLEDAYANVARIPVHIDWSQSGITVPAAADDEVNRVHRVSLRFFPQNGAKPFDVYMEEPNIIDATIDVPIGKYKVIAFNETIDDDAWWAGAMSFTDVNDYNKFAAYVVPYNAGRLSANFPFWHPAAGESVGSEPRKLASWSLGDFEVTQDMVQQCYTTEPAATRLSTQEEGWMNALTHIVMRRLTYNVTVTATVQNLVSSQANYANVSGFSDMVYMASAKTADSATTFPFMLSDRHYTNDTDGTATSTFLSFGRTPTPVDERYTLGMDVLYNSGELYDSGSAAGTPALTWDVSDQVESNPIGVDYDIDIDVSVTLAYIEGGIAVNDWHDGSYVIQ